MEVGADVLDGLRGSRMMYIYTTGMKVGLGWFRIFGVDLRVACTQICPIRIHATSKITETKYTIYEYMRP